LKINQKASRGLLIAVSCLPEVYQKVRSGEISNSMVVAAIGHYILMHGIQPPAW
jgi:hypothetical protein